MEKWFTHIVPNQFLFLNDFLLAPVAVFLIWILAKTYAHKQKSAIYKKYFVQAILVRIGFSILMAFVYQYHYGGGGDTNTFFTYSLTLRNILYENPEDFFKLLFLSPSDYFLANKYFAPGTEFFVNASSNLVIRLTTLLSYPLLNTYILISFCFSLFCFYGCWKIFKLFHQLYPHLEREFAFACLFIPSVCFWGTGILKDPLCLGALGALTYHLYKLIFERTKVFKRLILIIFCFWMLKNIKTYIILSFLPAYAFWVFFRYKELINSRILKGVMSPIIFIISIGIGIFVLFKVAAFSDRYALDQLMRTAKDTQNWIYYSSMLQGGSGYNLGDIEYSTMGLLKVFPKAVNVSLFRPYLWEAKKPILLPAAIEGVVSLFFTIRLLYKCGFIRFTKLIFSNPEVQFCMIFSVAFAFAVGFTSFNFGSLVRYKIPLMPFYFIALFILADKDKTDLENTAPRKKMPSKKPRPALTIS